MEDKPGVQKKVMTAKSLDFTKVKSVIYIGIERKEERKEAGSRMLSSRRVFSWTRQELCGDVLTQERREDATCHIERLDKDRFVMHHIHRSADVFSVAIGR